MRVLTSSQMKELDRLAVAKFGLPGIVLMENAGIAVRELISSLFKGHIKRKKIVVYCGPGNNGGDGYVVARHLSNMGSIVRCMAVGGSGGYKGDALSSFNSFVSYGGKVLEVLKKSDLPRFNKEFSVPDLVVDAIFGTGLKNKIKGIYADAIKFINGSGAPVVSVDVPSGLDSDTGHPLGVAVKAGITVTFGHPKPGLLVGDAHLYVGDLIVKDISLPKNADIGGDRISLIEPAMVKSLLKPRPADSHKGSFGHVLIVAGSKEKSGAAKLASIAALRSGAGLVTLAVPESIHGFIKGSLFNVMSLPLEDDGRGNITAKAVERIIENSKDKSAVGIGPGLNRSEVVKELIFKLASKTDLPLVIDADGLNSLAGRMKGFRGKRENMVFTPHPGEMSRLSGIEVGKIQRDRIGAAGRFSRKYGIVLALKGYRTVVAFPDGTIYINPTGNPGMAVGGMGDILLGMMTAYISQTSSFKAAVLSAVFNHGLLADLVASETGTVGMLATDLLNKITVINRSVFKQAKVPLIEELG